MANARTKQLANLAFNRSREAKAYAGLFSLSVWRHVSPQILPSRNSQIKFIENTSHKSPKRPILDAYSLSSGHAYTTCKRHLTSSVQTFRPISICKVCAYHNQVISCFFYKYSSCPCVGATVRIFRNKCMVQV